ncbi:hypothetical protein F5880DRAFT_1614938 [Lentinula raphanica]|nr:hypothetical protein F5880DRAFT_1614938 [Lentinula raphanica]
MRFRARPLSLRSLRPFFILFLVVAWLSTIAVIARPMYRPQVAQIGTEVSQLDHSNSQVAQSETVVYKITLSQVGIQSESKDFVGTGAVFVSVDPGPEQFDRDGKRLEVEQFYKDGKLEVTASKTVAVSNTFVDEISFPRGEEKDRIQRVRKYAQGFEYKETDGSINYWRYLTYVVVGLYSQSSPQNEQLKEKWQLGTHGVLHIKPEEDINLIEYVTASHKDPRGEVSVLIGNTVIFHSSPADHRSRIARTRYIGKIVDGVPPLLIQHLYDYAEDHSEFKASVAQIQELQEVENVWKSDVERPGQRQPQRTLWNLAQWRFVEGILNGLVAKNYISKTTLEQYQKIRSQRMSAYILHIESLKAQRRKKLVAEWEKRGYIGPEPHTRDRLTLLSFENTQG